MIGWAFIFAMVGVLPWMAFRSAQRINSGARPLPPRSALHFNTIVTLAILLAVSVFVARSEPLWIFRPFHPSWRDPAAIIGFLIITVTILLFRVRRLKDTYREKLERITMSDWRDPRQLLSYSLVALMAGIAEEIAYRGTLFMLLENKTGSSLAAVAIASVAFGAAHAVQGWRSAIAVGGFALLFHLIVLFTGDLYAAIVAHATYDLIAGIIIAQNARWRRIAAPPEPASVPSSSPTAPAPSATD